MAAGYLFDKNDIFGIINRIKHVFSVQYGDL